MLIWSQLRIVPLLASCRSESLSVSTQNIIHFQDDIKDLTTTARKFPPLNVNDMLALTHGRDVQCRFEGMEVLKRARWSKRMHHVVQ
jgi:hypothetical protein